MSHQPRGRTCPRNWVSKSSTQQPSTQFSLEWRRIESLVLFALYLSVTNFQMPCFLLKVCYLLGKVMVSPAAPWLSLHSQSTQSSSPTQSLLHHPAPTGSHSPPPGSLGLQTYLASTPQTLLPWTSSHQGMLHEDLTASTSFTHVGSTSGAEESAPRLGHSHTPIPSPEISIIDLIPLFIATLWLRSLQISIPSPLSLSSILIIQCLLAFTDVPSQKTRMSALSSFHLFCKMQCSVHSETLFPLPPELSPPSVKLADHTYSYLVHYQ